MRFVEHRWTPVAVLAAAMAATVFVYWNGLRGPFLFDDFANLPALGEFGRLDSVDKILRYLTSGFADPLGRPLAMASFLLDANQWPAEPFAFKRTNLLIHLFNGVLVYALLARLGAVAADAARARLAAALAAAAWLLHPLLVSTTLYVVQREAMLTATFVLLGLIVYVAGRSRLAEGRRGGTLLMLLGIGGGTLLAMLCKANGILLPLLALVLEITLLQALLQPTDAATRRLRLLRWLLLYLPSLTLLLLLLALTPSYIETAETYRSWSLGERLMTQPRVVLGYLKLLLLPRPFSPGLLNDSIELSRGWLTPGSTLPALVFIVLCIGVALRWRTRYPRCAAAVLFFFAGHLLESSVVPLEMYFEHRNYLPAALLFWPVAALAVRPGERLAARLGLAVLVLAGFAFMTRVHANLWSDGYRQAVVWAGLMPESPRAQANAAQFEISAGRPDAAEQRVRSALRLHPDEPQLTLNLIGARCALGTLDDADVELAARSVRTAPQPGELLSRWSDAYLEGGAACSRFTGAHLSRLVDAAVANPRHNSSVEQQQILATLQGRIRLLEHDGAGAHEAFDRALKLRPTPAAALRHAALMASQGYACEALRHLDAFDALKAQVPRPRPGIAMLHTYLLRRQNYWVQEFAQLRATIEEEIRGAGKDAAGCRASGAGVEPT